MAAPLKAGGLLIYRQIQSKTQYLLLQTSYGEHHWTPPKGHVDPGEDFRAAAVRETEEEAGLDETKLNIHNFEFRLEYNVKGRPKEVVYWLAELKDPNTPIRLSEEHQDYKWLPLSDACTYAKYDDIQKALKNAAEYIENSK